MAFEITPLSLSCRDHHTHAGMYTCFGINSEAISYAVHYWKFNEP